MPPYSTGRPVDVTQAPAVRSLVCRTWARLPRHGWDRVPDRPCGRGRTGSAHRSDTCRALRANAGSGFPGGGVPGRTPRGAGRSTAPCAREPSTVPCRRKLRDWRGSAVCPGTDPDLFFPVGTSISVATLVQTDEAKDVCDTCPVMRQCLESTLNDPAVEGRSCSRADAAARHRPCCSARRTAWVGRRPRGA
ncbi:WhiB family transcriptional regulator [Streptomyces sp. NPDC002580]|uniref:WhiB family transcriptional regulator n=1 Tax=Streptomyces sp. NPDC002580 TaxID=3364653 RepID=UPI00368663FD